MILPLKDREEIVAFLDQRYPEIGIDNTRFAVYVVLLSAKVLSTVDVLTLQEFTGYTRRFVQAVIMNLRLNGLIHKSTYDGSRWSKDGNIDDEKFGEDMEAASGMLYFRDAAIDLTMDIDYIEHDPNKRGALSFLQ